MEWVDRTGLKWIKFASEERCRYFGRKNPIKTLSLVKTMVFRALSNIYDEAFWKNSQPLKADNYICKRLHHRSLSSPLILFCSVTGKQKTFYYTNIIPNWILLTLLFYFFNVQILYLHLKKPVNKLTFQQRITIQK